MSYKSKKLKELILYVSQKCQTHRRFGKVKLNKILFFSDFVAYQRYGTPITGARYFKLRRGPAPRAMKPLFEEMVRTGQIAVSPRFVYGYTEQRPVPLREPDLSVFEPEEIDLVNDVIREFEDKTGEELSELSHLYIGYDLVEIQNDIPYHTVYCKHPSLADITPEDIEFALQLDK